MKTLAEALTLVPTHWLLVPRVDKWKEGDEWLHEVGGDERHWVVIERVPVPNRILTGEIVRRPIPSSVREAEARWILYSSAVKHLTEAKRTGRSTGFCQEGYGDYLVETHLNEDVEGTIGGESAVIQMLTEGPGALFRWVEENRK